MKKLALIPLISVALITGCGTTANNIIVAPQVFINKAPASSVEVSLDVQDLRTSSHIVEIFREGEAAQLFSSQAFLQDIIDKSVRDALKQSGIVSSQTSHKQVIIAIERANIAVHQKLAKYTANNDIKLIATVTNGDSTLTKAFTNKGNSNGILNADLAVLERDFNQQLGKLIAQLAQDNEIHAFLR